MPFLILTVSFLAIFVEAAPDCWRDNNWLAATLKYRWLKLVPRLPTIETSESACGELVGEVICVTATTVFGVVIPISPTTISLEPEGTTTILELTTVTIEDPEPTSPAESSSGIESSSQVAESTTSGESERTASTVSSASPVSSAMAASTISSQATTFATFSSSVLDRSESTTSSLISSTLSLPSSTQSSTPSSNLLNNTIPMNGIDSPSTPLSLDAKVGICSAGVMFFLFVLVTTIYLIRRWRQQRRNPSQYRNRNIPIEESIEMSGYPYGLRNTLARCFSRPSKEKPLSRPQPMSAMSDISHYASPHITADSTTMISSWVPTKAMRRYDCVVLSPEAQELHEHTQYVQESLDGRDDGSPSLSETSGQSIVEGYSVLGDGASREAARASTICTLGAKSEVDSAVVGGTW